SPLLPPPFFQCSGDLRALHSFPTRRSSDLPALLKRPSTMIAAALAHIAERRSRLGFAARTLRGLALPDEERYLTWTQDLFRPAEDRKSTRLNSSHVAISYAVFCLKKKITIH